MKFDGVGLAKVIYQELQENIAALRKKGITPHLAVLLVGDNPASKSYIAQKKKWAKYIGATVTVIHYPVETTTEILRKTISDLNTNPSIHGIIVQRPLPGHIDKQALALHTAPTKDIDGFHPDTTFVIPVAAAAIRILEEIFRQTKHTHHDFIDWLQSVPVITLGKGDTAGKPIIDYLKRLGVSPIIVDSKTMHPDEVIRKGTVIITSVGVKNLINKNNIKPGAILIGVGITKDREEGTVGDYNEQEIAEIASFYTPTPGGVGPVNVAYLLKNLVTAAEHAVRK